MDLQFGKAKNKGRRYCFIAAIQVPHPMGTESAGLVPNSVMKFCPQKKNDSAGDYHKVFNSGNFVPWFRDQLIANRSAPSIIYMDNAGYHKTLDSTVPKPAKLRKAALREWMTQNNVPFNNADTRPVLIVKAREWIKANCKPECVLIAESKGHKVVWTPPCYSDLQPIELVWALIKGNIGRQYTVNTTLSMVLQRLDREFATLRQSGAATINKIIEKCATKGKEMYDELQEQLDDEYDEDDENSDDESADKEYQEQDKEETNEDADTHNDLSDNEEVNQNIVGV
jgi:transposase